MYERLRTHILPKVIPAQAKVLVAVSGGPDSMALSHILWRYGREAGAKGVSLVLTHVHHGLRKESDDEVRLVQEMAVKWGLPCSVHYFDAKNYAQTRGQSFQEAARDWRYARWKEDMLENGCSLLATAHHLGDQAETILHRLLRGSGPTGLAGIYPAKDAVIRPLLEFGKGDILRYCAQEGLPYALDASNEEPIYLRNRIRLELLPELEKNYNPRIQEILGRTGEIMRWDEEYFAEQVKTAWRKYCLKSSGGKIGLSREVFTEPAAILSRILRKAVMLATDEDRGIGFNYILKIMETKGNFVWRQDLPGVTVKITAEGIWFNGQVSGGQDSARGWNCPKEQRSARNFPEIIVKYDEWSPIPSLRMDIGLWDKRDMAPEDEIFVGAGNKVAVFSRELLEQCAGLVCRTRRQGDRMWFRGVGHKSLKKIFQEAHIAVQERNGMPLLAYGAEVLWIPGVRQSGLYAAKRNSKKVYCVLRPQFAPSL